VSTEAHFFAGAATEVADFPNLGPFQLFSKKQIKKV